MDHQSFYIRVPKKWVRLAMLLGVAALITAPLTAVATHAFEDVSTSNTFHDDIAWLKAAGVTKGCNPPANTQYCPDDNVTRGQMSAFMRRLAENQVVDAGALEGYSADGLGATAAFNSNEGPDSTAGSRTISAEITAPAPGVLVMNGSMLTFAEFGDDTTTCWLEVNQEKVHGSETHTTQEQTADNGCTATGAQVVDAGTYTVDLEASGPDWYWDENVWVMWIPFDGTGATP
jgi:hypothetical protein